MEGVTAVKRASTALIKQVALKSFGQRRLQTLKRTTFFDVLASFI
jgi:hypothetical protein